MFEHCVVAGGTGAVGRMFADRLAASGAEVLCVDPAATGPGAVADDICAPGPATARALAGADLVLLAVPEAVALDAVRPVTRLMRTGALFADTLSVKEGVARRLRAEAPGVQAVGLNPMFAPSLPLPGRPVAAAVVTDGPAVRDLLALIADWGGQVVETTPDEHDRQTAAQQAATHAAVLAFGLALGELGADVAALRATAPPPHRTLLELLARVASGTPEVYWDVQAANPHAEAARQAVGRGLERLGRAVAGHRPEAFEALFDELRSTLGERNLTELADACADSFARPR
ncbi:prephenate dehydrogenase/arogenate dehydrogenase family protein [Streptomyces xanthii]|uniref:Prephenate dehydrogenase/arogenate dehydrogenase family protein n=1 Tax=Streptomyces xanthii TaxID=2768069 RepID=A0A7H1BKG1_9ACTN|nr:prephenate dehydrogenase/arogenate dehydrogenase family protein [Streptomyces xanthii]QNS09216.1 prephenate dehydrogenase/arogenate dehydrogenase family protein [Streptomyces xanthii]